MTAIRVTVEMNDKRCGLTFEPDRDGSVLEWADIAGELVTNTIKTKIALDEFREKENG